MGLINRWKGRLSEVEFAARLIKSLQDAGDDRRCRYDPAEFQLHFELDDRDVGYANLRNLYDEYCNQRTQDDTSFFRFAVRSLLVSHKPLPEDYNDLACDLLVSVRSRSYFSLLELKTQVETGTKLSWPYCTVGEHLGVALTYDLPEAMIMLQGSHLDHWGTTFYQAYEQALQNLSELNATFLTLGDQTYGSATGDCYDASRMLLPELLGELKVQGDPVIMVPQRDHLIVTGTEDRAGLELMVTLAKEFFDMPRPVSGFAFVSIDNDWQPWLPPNEHPSHTPLKWLRLRSIEHDYREQRELLLRWQSECPAVGEPQEFRVHGAGQRTPVSYCVWHEGASQLLPQADRVCLEYANQSLRHPLVEGVNCSWSELIELAGNLLLEEEDLYPTRYRTLGFPSAEQIAKLRQ